MNYQNIDEKVKEEKEGELEEVRKTLEQRKKAYEKQKRKEFFLENKYGQIKQVETTKIQRLMKKNKAAQSEKPEDQGLKD